MTVSYDLPQTNVNEEPVKCRTNKTITGNRIRCVNGEYGRLNHVNAIKLKREESPTSIARFSQDISYVAW